MSTSGAPTETKARPRALSSLDGETWQDSPGDGPVTAIVIGALEKGSTISNSNALLRAGLEIHKETLTHLHLWHLEDLRSLPELPPELIIEGAGRDDYKQPALIELSLRNVPGIADSWIRSLLKAVPALRVIQIVSCPQLEDVDIWPPALEDLRLVNCERLRVLPEGWPPRLHRLELARAAVASLDGLPESIRYLNFSGMRNLRKLPPNWERAGTLSLFRSGLLEPSVSEHGESTDPNVAVSAKKYFAERKLAGDGSVKRCKILMLGNGDAGKTCLSLGIVGEDTRRAKKLGSTHGVQFWPFERRVPVRIDDRERMLPVPLHIWDFGGQQIYHDVHRLFMENGSVFLVLWHPEQDGKRGPRPVKPGRPGLYVDEWRPLKYWFDLIRVARPHHPKIAVVRSRRRETDDALRKKLELQIGKDHAHDCELFSIDSCPDDELDKPGPVRPKGEVAGLEKWLKDSVGEVISTKGTVVPSYWEIAQDLAEGWVRRVTSDKEEDREFRGEFRQIPFETFASDYRDAFVLERESGEDVFMHMKLSSIRPASERNSGCPPEEPGPRKSCANWKTGCGNACPRATCSARELPTWKPRN